MVTNFFLTVTDLLNFFQKFQIRGHSKSTFVEGRGEEVIEKRTKTNRGRGRVLAFVYAHFKKKC